MRYGDYTEWSLLVLGKKSTGRAGEKIRFEVPITILKKSVPKKEEGVDLFTPGVTGGMNVFEQIPSKFQKRFKLVSIESESKEGLNEYSIRFKNISKKDLEGVTVKLSGLQEGLFETNPQLIGFHAWKQDEEKHLSYQVAQNISTIISVIEDNSQKSVRIQNPISF